MRNWLIIFCCFFGHWILAHAADYHSLSEVAIMYDAPSLKSNKLAIAPAGMPIKVVVTLDAWAKVRDATGDLSWVERKVLGEKLMLVTLISTIVRQAANERAAEVFQVNKGVLLELVSPPMAQNASSGLPSSSQEGWAQVRHIDGQMGYIPVSAVWGL